MIKVYKNLISSNEADSIYHSFMNIAVFKNGILNSEAFEDRNLSTNGRSFGWHNLPETLTIIDRINKIVLSDFGDNYKFSHSYARLYPDKGILHPHIDRETLDLTLTVNVYSNKDNLWPIYYSNKLFDFNQFDNEQLYNIYCGNPNYCYELLHDYLDNSIAIITNKGDGACSTRNIVHWRKIFNAKYDGEHYVQVFYHWKALI